MTYCHHRGYAKRTVTPSMIVAPVPNSRRASPADIMRICSSVGSRASSASLPGSIRMPFERMEETSGMESRSSVTT